MRGIFRSVSTTSNGASSKHANASAPSPACTTSWPKLRSDISSTRRILASSSTTKILCASMGIVRPCMKIEFDVETGATPRALAHRDAREMRLHDLLHDGVAETDATFAPRKIRVENPCAQVERHTGAVVGHARHQCPVTNVRRDLAATADGREVQRSDQQIHNLLDELLAVAGQHRLRRAHCALQ